MEELPYVNLPDHFTHLLKVNMQSTTESFRGLQEYIWKDRALNGLFEHAFRGIDKDLRINNIIRVVGWHGLRDRLTAMFLHYKQHGDWPKEPRPQDAESVNFYEVALRPFSVDGHSRGYLLGLYVEMARLQGAQGESLAGLNRLRPEAVVTLLEQSHARVSRIDWLVFAAAHFSALLGENVAVEYIRNKLSFKDLVARLDVEQKARFLKNLLTYGSSINDMEFFMGTRV